MKRLLQILSYVMVALAAASLTFIALTLGFGDRFAKLEQLQTVIRERYVGQVEEEALLDGAAQGMVEALGDRWSHYMTREEFADYQDRMNNSYVGVGMTVTLSDRGYVLIQKVEPLGPAAEAGILGGDELIGVNGMDIRDMGLEAVSDLVRGEKGTFVTLTLQRGQQTLTLEVERRTVETLVAEGRMLEDGIGLVTIHNFDSRCAQETIASIEALLEQGARALIFDVRNNPGGYKEELVKVLDYLLPEGDLFRSTLYNGKQEVDRSGPDCLNIPMAVLANGNSYSAAEFFAAALVEYEAAVYVGEPTTGKGRFQSTYRLADGSAVTISIGTYTTPKNVDLTDVGLTPDVTVTLDPDTAAQVYYGTLPPEEDPQIMKAWQLLTGAGA